MPIQQVNLIPVENTANLRARVERLLKTRQRPLGFDKQIPIDYLDSNSAERAGCVKDNIYEFLNFITDAVPSGDVYLFGGVIRDLALFGGKGFDSDIDLVVDGDWSSFEMYLCTLGARKNKFGGFRLNVGEWPVDIWNARETWAVKNSHVEYKGIASLTNTTVLNWDAILMNWRTRSFIFRDRYFEDIRDGLLDVVLIPNPNPLGMAVRVFRHLYLKEAKKITKKAATYLSNCSNIYSYDQIRQAEHKSYRNSYISEPLYAFFKYINVNDNGRFSDNYEEVSAIIKKQYEFKGDGGVVF